MSASLAPGTVIGGYRIVSEIATGGMGTVYRAAHVDLERQAAIKVLRPELSSQEDVVQRFLREGKMIARLNHPGIVKIYDLGKDGQSYFLAMELIEGTDLDNFLSDVGPLSPGKALLIIRQVAAALECAHSQGIIHRDIKPSNIILAADGTARLTDFGIARLQQQDTLVTRNDVIIGTPVYMSPEQCRGAPVDARSDLYSLGATFYTLVSGRPPFTGKNPATLIHQIIHDNPQPVEALVPEMSPEIGGIIRRLMAKHPAARFQSGRDLCEAIDATMQKRLSFSRAESEDEAPARGRESWARGAVALVLALAAAFGIYTLWSSGRSAAAGGEEGARTERATVRESGKRRPPARGGRDSGDEGRTGGRSESLSRRIDALKSALSASDAQRALRFVDPEVREDPDVRMQIAWMIERLEAQGPDARIEHWTTTEGSRVETLFQVDARESDGKPLQMRLQWTQRGSEWFARPQVDEEARKPKRKPIAPPPILPEPILPELDGR